MDNENKAQSERSTAKIQLFRMFEPTELDKVKVSTIDDDGREHKDTLSKFDGEIPEVLLFCVETLRAVARRLNFEDNDYWDNWDKALEGDALEEWRNLLNEIDDEEYLTEDLFNTTLNAFITHYFPQGSRSKIFDYVRDLKFGDKPGSMQLHRLVSRLKTIRRLAMLIPDATNLRMAEHELTKKVYELSPPNQRDNVKRKFNDDITGTSLADMERALETEIEIAHAKKQRNGNRKHQRNNGDRVQSNQATTQQDQEDGNNSNHNSNIQGGWVHIPSAANIH